MLIKCYNVIWMFLGQNVLKQYSSIVLIELLL